MSNSNISTGINTPTFSERRGCWNENGLVQSLNRKGFTLNKCWREMKRNMN